MRTTVTLTDEVYELASVYASARGITLGSALGELVLKTHASPPNSLEGRMVIRENGLPLIRATGQMITSEMVKAAQEDELG